MPITMLGSKIVIGILGLVFLLSSAVSSRNINAKIYYYENNQFYGDLIINKQKIPIILELCEENNEKTTNTNIDKKEKNEKITDNKTPGSIKIKIKNEKGQEIVFDRNMGSGEVSDFDQECIGKITDALSEYIGSIKGRSVPKTIKDGTVGFLNYCKKDKNRKWFKW